MNKSVKFILLILLILILFITTWIKMVKTQSIEKGLTAIVINEKMKQEEIEK